MKKKYLQLSVLMLLLSVFIFPGCSATNSINVNKYLFDEMYVPSNIKQIRIHSISFPKEPFIELATITTEDIKDMYKLKEEAAKLGADAIVILGPTNITDKFGMAKSGYKTVAIKYTDNVTKK
jgi:hypothetical protein